MLSATSSFFVGSFRKKINISAKAIQESLLKYGQGSFLILFCYCYSGKTVQRYVGNSNRLVTSFSQAEFFQNEDLATSALGELKVIYPNRLFNAIELSRVANEA